MAVIVAGDQYEGLDGQLSEIKRQLRQKGGYPYDPGQLKLALQAIIEGRFQAIVTEQSAKAPQIEYFIPVSDEDVPEQYKSTLVAYRKLAAEHGVAANTAVCYRVQAGFTLKSHAPKAAPCHDSYRYLQDWNFQDKATSNSFVFWVPRIMNDSTNKTTSQQITFLADLRTQLELPDYHMSGFGQVGLVAGLILAYFKATGERIPLNNCWARTDTCD